MPPFIEHIEEVGTMDWETFLAKVDQGPPSKEQVRRDIATYPQAAIDAMDLLVEATDFDSVWVFPVLHAFRGYVDAYHQDGAALELHEHAWVDLQMGPYMPELMRLLEVEVALDGWRWPVSYAPPPELITEANPTYGMF